MVGAVSAPTGAACIYPQARWTTATARHPDSDFIMHLSKSSVGMMGLQMSRIAHPITKLLLPDGIERDPPRPTAVKLARVDHATVDPVIDDVRADRETIRKLTHGEFFGPLERN